MRFAILAATMVLAGGCDQPAPVSVGREEPPKSEKESFSGFTSGTPLPQSADSRVADEPSATPSPSVAPDVQAAAQDYAKALRDLRQDPATRPPDNFDASDPAAVQRLNNAIIGHMQQIEDAQDRLRAAKKKEPDPGE